jgi:hypothetical protein
VELEEKKGGNERKKASISETGVVALRTAWPERELK